jgi:rhamnopyranosyl-N-acetylglucosaminyl-diphospho-decaprenol beta-1,3/1,4-galactofuranosyltransferase
VTRVVAVVVTYNRKRLLMTCLQALARQSRPVERVVVVDNASTDGTEELVRESGIAERLAIDYLRLRRNGGGAEGFHYGVRAALTGESDWLWLMDDDCEPRDDCLERLLSAEPARAPSTAVLAPVVRADRGQLLPINRGSVRPRWFFAPLQQVPAEAHDRPATEIQFCSFVGPLVRADAARRIGLPMREMFIRFEDVEYLGRLGPDERMWLIGPAEIVHRDPQPVTPGLAARWHEFRQGAPFSEQWKRLYGVRNQLYAARKGGYATAPQAVSQVVVQAVRTLLFHERRRRTLRLLVLYARDGWRGRFRNVPPARWAQLATAHDPVGFIEREALRYDADEAPPAERLRAAPAPPSRPA